MLINPQGIGACRVVKEQEMTNQTSNATMEVHSSNGKLRICLTTGKVIKIVTDVSGDPNFTNTLAFNLAEHRAAYPGREFGADIDILDLGYWIATEQGTTQYEPPCAEWRKERDAMAVQLPSR